VSEKKRRNLSMSEPKWLASYMPASSCVEPKNLKILVVHSKSSERTCNILQDCSYNVVAVKTSKQAMEKLDENIKFDLILKEHEPPESNACRMLRKIWKHKEHRNIPVVVFSSRYDSKIIQECLQHGAADYMIKPLRHNEARTLWIRVWTRMIAMQFNPFRKPVQNKVISQIPPMSKPVESGVSTASDADDNSREGSNPNENDREAAINGNGNGNRNGSGSGSGSGSGADCNRATSRGGIQTEAQNIPLNQEIGFSAKDKDFGKTFINSAFQAFNSPRKRSVEGNGNSNGKNATSNVVGPQHGNGSNGNGSNGNGSNGNGSNGNGSNGNGSNGNGSNGNGSNGNGNHESNGASSRRIMPKAHPHQISNGNTPTKPPTEESQFVNQNGAPMPWLPFDASMTLTPFGPMPTHLAQTVSWGMQQAAQQEANFMAMQYAQAYDYNINMHQQQIHANATTLKLKEENGKSKGKASSGQDQSLQETSSMQGGSGKTTSTQTAKQVSSKNDGADQTSAERRAAALDKYRMKRKMLCFSKKIRYASRKQLAEARPRNKGQFVRCNERTTESTEATEVTEATEATEATVSMKRAKY